MFKDTLRPCDVENMSDFHRYYHSCYVGIPRNGKVSPGLVISCGETNSLLQVITKQQDGSVIPVNEQIDFINLKSNSLFSRPLLGMISVKDRLMYQSVKGERAPKKGYNPRSTSHKVFLGWDVSTKIQVPRTADYDVVWTTYNPEYVGFREAFHKLANGDSVGLATSRNTGLFNPQDSEYPLIAYKRWTIGHMRSPNEAVLPNSFSDYVPVLEDMGLEVRVNG